MTPRSEANFEIPRFKGGALATNRPKWHNRRRLEDQISDQLFQKGGNEMANLVWLNGNQGVWGYSQIDKYEIVSTTAKAGDITLI